jgi:hypothetical protein
MKIILSLFLLLALPFLLFAQQQPNATATQIIVECRGFNPKRYVEIEHMQDYTVPAGNLFVFEGYSYRLPENTSPENMAGIGIYLDGGLPGIPFNPQGFRPNYINVRRDTNNVPNYQSIRGITVGPGTMIEISCAGVEAPDDCDCSSIASNCEPTLVAWGYLEKL